MSDKMEKLLIVKAKADDNRTITAIGSLEKTDRDKDIVKVAGINVKAYKKNPVVLFAHGHRDLPIGKATRVWKKDGQLNFKIEFAEEKHNPMAPFVYEQYKDGFLNAFSISFIPDYSTTTYDEKKGVRTIHDSELLEISAVPVPANADALIMREYRDRCEKAWDNGNLDGLDLNEIDDAIEKSKVEEPIDKEAQEDLHKTITELESKIAELSLQVKEQEVEEETTDDIYTQLYDEFVGPSGQEDPEQTGEQTVEPLTIEDVENLLNEE